MPRFVFAYHGGKKPETPEAGQELMTKWRAWMDSIRASVEDPGFPVGMSKTVTATGVEDNEWRLQPAFRNYDREC